MGSDEAGTLAQLEALRTGIIEPQIAKHAGGCLSQWVTAT
jgi:adenylate cyclase